MPLAPKFSGVHYTPDGKVMHAELKIGDSRLMLADEFPSFGSVVAEDSGRQPGRAEPVLRKTSIQCSIRRCRAGAIVTMPLGNQFWGDRYGQITDPFGHRWALGQHIEDVAPEEMERRAKKRSRKMANGRARSNLIHLKRKSSSTIELARGRRTDGLS